MFKEILKEQKKENINSLNSFVELLSEAMQSSIMNVKVMAARMMFQLLKALPYGEPFDRLLDEGIQNLIGKSVYLMVKNRVSTYRQLGIKLSSVVLLMNTESKSAIENELFTILSTEDNELIRKMVMTNIPLTMSNIDKILTRLRDKSPDIRAILLRRLLSDKFGL